MKNEKLSIEEQELLKVQTALIENHYTLSELLLSQGYFLSYMNDFITVDKCCEYWNKSKNDMNEAIMIGRCYYNYMVQMKNEK